MIEKSQARIYDAKTLGRSSLVQRSEAEGVRRYAKIRRWTIESHLFFFQAEDGIRDYKVTGVQTCALPILAGIERSFDQRLRGRPGKMLITMDARHRWVGRVEKNPEPGQNLVLTIDEDIQHIVERELDRIIAEKQPKAVTAIVENPRTGEILALANRPTFNPNEARAISPQSLKNRAVSDIYEPGSTFKMVTISAALEENLTNPNEVIDCQIGSIVVNGTLIHDWHRFGSLTVADVLANSSDVGSIKLGMRLGEDRLYHYIRAYGFGTQTGIELSGETRGITKPVSRWSKMSIGAISMGQEIGVSPLQLVAMTSTIANDGLWTAPRIVAGTTPSQEQHSAGT